LRVVVACAIVVAGTDARGGGPFGTPQLNLERLRGGAVGLPAEPDLPTAGEQTQPLPEATDAETGAAVAGAGDLDGDGIEDLLVGAPGYVGDTVCGAGAAGRGAAIVYLGSSVESERADPDVVFCGVTAHDRTGVSVAGGFDFTGDGRLDLLVGAEQVDRTDPQSPVATGSGRVYLISFDPDDYPHLDDPALDIVDLSLVGQPGGIPGVRLTGECHGDRAGYAVAGGGRANAGSVPDILVGAPGRDAGAAACAGGKTDAGSAYVLFDAALSGTVSLARVANGMPDEVAGVVYLGEAAGDGMGFAVAFTPDVTGDALDDLAIGAPFAATPTAAGAPSAHARATPTAIGAGKVYVPAAGGLLNGIIEGCDIGGSVAGSQVRGSQAGMQLGSSVSSGGDNVVDGDGDLLMGARGYDATSDAGGLLEDAGLVVQASAPLAGIIESDDVGGSLAGVEYTGTVAQDQLGAAVAALGDVTGDGRDDVAFGAPRGPVQVAEVPPPGEGGTVYVVQGSPDIPSGTVAASEIGSGVAGAKLLGAEPGERAGSALAPAGDFNGDLSPDFAVGAPSKDVLDELNAGVAYVVQDGLCGVDAACILVDPATGAQLEVLAGSLAAPASLSVVGLTAAAPAWIGQSIAGAADFDADGAEPDVVFCGPPLTPPCDLPTVHLPVWEDLERHFALGESAELAYLSDGEWTRAGANGTVVANPHVPGGLAVVAQVGVLRVWGILVPDGDADGYDDVLDCAASDGSLWTVPGEVQALVLARPGGVATLSWEAPQETGATGVLYDTIRSTDPSDFIGAGACIGTDVATTAIDPSPIAPGQAFFYLVRARNSCGDGSLGTDSSGVPRVAVACP
jgi:hypothetical protein